MHDKVQKLGLTASLLALFLVLLVLVSQTAPMKQKRTGVDCSAPTQLSEHIACLQKGGAE